MFLLKRLYASLPFLSNPQQDGENQSSRDHNMGDMDESAPELEEEELASTVKDSKTETEIKSEVNDEPHPIETFYNIKQLRKMTDYEEAKSNSDYIVMGRQKGTSRYSHKKDFGGKIFNPENRNEEWTCEKNAAFWAGGMESQATFRIVTRLNEIIERAKFGFIKGYHTDGYFGVTANEMLWLEDNGYTFEPDTKNSNYTLVKPPKEKITEAVLRSNYGSCHDYDADTQIKRLEDIAKNVAKKRYFVNQVKSTLVDSPFSLEKEKTVPKINSWIGQEKTAREIHPGIGRGKPGAPSVLSGIGRGKLNN